MIETTIDDRFVATVTVNNPEQRNALGNAGKRELAEAIERVSATDGLRVVILTGAGDKSFIGGANLKEMSGFVRHDASEGPALTHRVCEAIRRTPVPVIARINGWCLGAGLEIAAVLRHAGRRRHRPLRHAGGAVRPALRHGGLPAAATDRLGQNPGTGLHRPPHRLRRSHACHLVERVAPPDELDQAVEDWVAAILKAGPNAIRAQKELIRDWERMSIADAVQQGIRAVAAAHGTDEAKRA